VEAKSRRGKAKQYNFGRGIPKFKSGNLYHKIEFLKRNGKEGSGGSCPKGKTTWDPNQSANRSRDAVHLPQPQRAWNYITINQKEKKTPEEG